MPQGNKAAYTRVKNLASINVSAITAHLGSSFEDRTTSAIWAITGFNGRNSLLWYRFRSPEISCY
jgi:hypothetical protein